MSVSLLACEKVIPDYSVDEAFTLMNEAIANYLAADSLSVEYTGNYSSTNYNNNEAISIKLKNMNSDNMIGKVIIDITENETPLYSLNSFEDGWIYTARNQNGTTDYIKKQITTTEYLDLYKSFLKSTITSSDTRDVSILVDSEQLTVFFELSSTAVEDDLFVSNVLSTVRYASVEITLTHDAVIKELVVSYEATINQVVGTQTYRVNFLSVDKYVIIDQLSSTEKAMYQEDTTSE